MANMKFQLKLLNDDIQALHRPITLLNILAGRTDIDPDFVKKLESEISGIIFKLLNTFQNPLEAKVALESQNNDSDLTLIHGFRLLSDGALMDLYKTITLNTDQSHQGGNDETH